MTRKRDKMTIGELMRAISGVKAVIKTSKASASAAAERGDIKSVKEAVRRMNSHRALLKRIMSTKIDRAVIDRTYRAWSVEHEEKA